MKTQNDFKKLLKLNRLPYFQDLTESQREKIKGFEKLYRELNPDFQLPPKWKIAINEESIIPVGKWRRSGPSGNMRKDHPRPHGWCTSPEGWYTSQDIEDSSYEKITLEQFKKYVLKDENRPRIQENITLEPPTRVRRSYARTAGPGI